MEGCEGRGSPVDAKCSILVVYDVPRKSWFPTPCPSLERDPSLAHGITGAEDSFLICKKVGFSSEFFFLRIILPSSALESSPNTYQLLFSFLGGDTHVIFSHYFFSYCLHSRSDSHSLKLLPSISFSFLIFCIFSYLFISLFIYLFHYFYNTASLPNHTS